MRKKHDRRRTLEEDQDQHRSLQDDRAALDVDANDPSALVEGEGAPLADDGVAAQPRSRDVATTPIFLGGAPVFTSVPSKVEDD